MERENDINLDDVLLLDEDGNETHFAHLLTFLYEGERYIALEPLEEGAARSDAEAEVVLFCVKRGKDGDVYEPVESEILANEVFDEFLRLMDEREEGGEG